MTGRTAQSDQTGASGSHARFAERSARGSKTANASMQRGLTMTNSYNLLRDALSWFSSHEVEKKLGHLPQWVVMARELLPDSQAAPIDKYTTEERTQIPDRRTTMDELISKTALLKHLRKERDDYMRAHFGQDPATGTWEASDPKVEFLGELEERIDFIEQFPPVEPIGKLINNNQPGWVNLIETAPNVTIDVGTPVFVAR
jgi:hypothetical protein